MSNPYNVKIGDLPEEFRGIAEIIGLENALAVVKIYGGSQQYIPKLETITRQGKYRQIFDDYQKYGNFGRVARKHGLSESHTRQIVKDEKRRRFPVRHVEVSLF